MSMYRYEIAMSTKKRVPTIGFLANSLKLIGKGFAEMFVSFFAAIIYSFLKLVEH